MTSPILQVDKLKMYFPVKEGILMRATRFNRAVDGVSLSIRPGETLGLVGESGCGKSTLGRCIARLYKPTEGRIDFEGTDITQLSGKALLPYRKDIQMIFQDPMESLNARHTVGDILEEPFIIHRIGSKQERTHKVRRLLDIVGLPARSVTRYPFEFSGGQRQRISIARSIALNPKLVICDEPVSALDVSIQSQILNLLVDLQEEFNLAYLFIAHDLAVVKHISNRIAIMYLGKIFEEADGEAIYQSPQHPYTESLISAIPIPDPRKRIRREVIKGDVPSPINPPRGCSFHPRCPKVIDTCHVEQPSLRTLPDRKLACHLALDAVSTTS
ncbi:MAG TPA: peptide ABC transporter substrate-binding protein [Gammaproteobacteria bacterium]|nr:peptide ABC transporter substrate-binding protein [Gammaproteobacteria bacterium]